MLSVGKAEAEKANLSKYDVCTGRCYGASVLDNSFDIVLSPARSFAYAKSQPSGNAGTLSDA